MRKACLEAVYALAKKDPRVVFVGSDIGSGTLDAFKRDFPDRFFMEGVSEGHLVGMMAGLAMTGKVPYFNTIATFITRRAFEQIFLDLGLHQLKVRLIGSGGGTVYAPLGPTHVALEDIALMRTVPGMTILAPCDAAEMKQLLPQTLEVEGPVYIRLAKGGDTPVGGLENESRLGTGRVLRRGEDVLLVSTGVAAQVCMSAAALLEKQGKKAGVIHFHTVNPFNFNDLYKEVKNVRALVTVEEHVLTGGLGSTVAEALADRQIQKKMKRVAFPDAFVHRYGSQDFLMKQHGVTPETVAAAAMELLK